jgi:hypothetical protein
VVDARDFRADWVTNGPMVPNLAPGDAIVRLKLFQQMFEAPPPPHQLTILPLMHNLGPCPANIQLSSQQTAIVNIPIRKLH